MCYKAKKIFLRDTKSPLTEKQAWLEMNLPNLLLEFK